VIPRDVFLKTGSVTGSLIVRMEPTKRTVLIALMMTITVVQGSAFERKTFAME